MNRAQKCGTYSLMMLLFVLVACGGEDKANTKLQGNWQLLEAYRNERPTESMRNLYYHFSEDVVRTNFTGKEQTATYSFAENKIILENGGIDNKGMALSFDAIFLNDTTMELQTNIQNHSFRFLLLKKDSFLLKGI